MKSKLRKSKLRISIALSLLALSPAVYAQVDVGGAATGAAGAAVNPPTNPPTIQPQPQPPAPQVSGAAGAGTAADVNASRSLNATVKGDTNASAAARDGRLMAEVPVGTRASASLHGEDTVRMINRQTLETRDRFVTDIDARLKASRDAQGDIKKSADGLKGEAKAKVSASMDRVKDREKALKKSLKAFRKASADELSEARSQLSADYKAYADAVTEMETTVSAANRTRAQAGSR